MAVSMRRERLLQVAQELFARKGYSATSLRQVADQAGCSKAAVYHHFAAKEDLLASMAEPFVSEVAEILTRVDVDIDADDDRVAVIGGYIRALIEHRNVARALLLDTDIRVTPTGERILDQQRRLVSRLAGPRASLRQQVRARCALSIAHLMVGELASVADHRLRQPLLEAAIDSLVLRSDDSVPPAKLAGWYKVSLPVPGR